MTQSIMQEQYVKPPTAASDKNNAEQKRLEAFRVASKVIANQISYEEGLLRALSFQGVNEFIDSLNSHSPEQQFSHAQALELIKSGQLNSLVDSKSLNRANGNNGHQHEGVVAPLEQAPRTKNVVPAAQDQQELERLDWEIQTSTRDLSELQNTIQFLEEASREDSLDPPSWMNSVVCMLMTTILGISISVSASRLWGGIVVAMGIVFSVFSYVQDRTFYEQQNIKHKRRKEKAQLELIKVKRHQSDLKKKVESLNSRREQLQHTKK